MSVSAVLNPKASGKLIVQLAKHVSINKEGVEKAAKSVYEALGSGKLSTQRFKQTELHPREANEKSIDWIFLIDTLNFSFWSGGNEEPKWKVSFHGKVYTGYFALCAGVNRAIEEGMNLTDPRVFGSLSEEDILRIFRSDTSTPIPMIEQRIENLKEASAILLEKYEGSFVNCVKASEQSAQKLLDLIVNDFPSYRDQGIFENVPVSFWKRAQILIGDIWACYEGKGLGHFSDIDSLSMFPDYRIPQVLLHFGAITYSPELYSLLEKEVLLESGSRHEMEIRGASIHAVELIKENVAFLIAESVSRGDVSRDHGSIFHESINSIMIDHFLWDYRRDHVEDLDKYPFHKVRCIFY